MLNKTYLQRLMVAAGIGLFSLLSTVCVEARPMMGGLLSEGMLACQPEKFTRSGSVIKQEKKSNQSFFGTMGPDLSAIGSVKTYSIKVVKNLKAADWKKVKERNQDYLDKSSKCLLRPVQGRVSSVFGRRKHPKTHSWHFHAGIDIVAKKGTPIMAGMAGKVIFSGWKRGYGMVVIVEHGDKFETVYAHCSRVLVKKGQVVSTGQKIARIGNTGVATGSHLHFEVRRGGNVRNPFRYIKN